MALPADGLGPRLRRARSHSLRVIAAARRNSSRALDAAGLEQEITRTLGRRWQVSSFPVATSCSTEDFVLAGRMFIMPKPFPLEFRRDVVAIV